MFEFTVGAASQGFEVKSINVNQEMATVVLVDVTDQDAMKRAIHASQFAYQLWVYRRTEISIVDYMTKQGQLYLRATVSGADCEKVLSGEREFDWLAGVVKFHLFKVT